MFTGSHEGASVLTTNCSNIKNSQLINPRTSSTTTSIFHTARKARLHYQKLRARPDSPRAPTERLVCPMSRNNTDTRGGGRIYIYIYIYMQRSAGAAAREIIGWRADARGRDDAAD